MSTGKGGCLPQSQAIQGAANLEVSMCGIAGLWSTRPRSRDALSDIAKPMRDALTHRGPDSSGLWIDAPAGIALAHRRLAILDLSPDGHQPMHSTSDRYVLIFNGEIFNFESLRTELEATGAAFRSHSDTEVLLAGIEHWGLHKTIDRAVGQFAIALWDREERVLSLVRDRLGIKPLYWGRVGGDLVFASELSALRVHPGFRGTIDRAALAAYLRFSHVPAPHSIYEGVHKLLPGHVAVFRSSEHLPELTCFWSPAQTARAGREHPFAGSPDEAVHELEQLLGDSIRLRMLSDVPLGAFLSGGIDSSTVVALMQHHSTKPVRTFSIGYTDAAYNEASDARRVAEHLGTDHTELILEPQHALDVIPRLPSLYDEPFADTSQIPTFLVCHLARQSVTVSLSGDGGDELFAGYNRHVWGPKLWGALRRVPRPLRRLGARSMTSIAPSTYDRLFSRAGRLLPQKMQLRVPGDKAHKLARIVGTDSPAALYRQLRTHWDHPTRIAFADHEAHAALDTDAAGPLGFAEQMMLADLQTYLPDDILTKVDRAAMGVSLEARVPLLDHRVVEWAWRLPMSMKQREGQSKWVLRQVLYRHVPRALVDRPKMGFGVPLDSWLRGPLRDWAEDLLEPGRMTQEGYLRPDPIRQAWADHQAGQRNNDAKLWDVLMFQAWRREQG